MALRFHHIFALLLACAVAAVARSARTEAVEPVVPEFWLPEATPALVEAARSSGIAVTGHESDPARANLVPGDTVTLLVERLDGKKRRQWLIALFGSELSEQDRALPPQPEMRLFTSTGNELVFAGTRAALAIRVIGPVPVEEPVRRPPKDVWSGALVNGDFLRMGFARGEAALQRLREARRALSRDDDSPFSLSALTRPFPENSVAAQRAAAKERGITPEDEHAIVGSSPALFEFFNVASRTPGVSEIMKSVINIPIWSIMLRGGTGLNLNIKNLGSSPIDPASWNLQDSTEIYERAFLLELNNRPAVCCRMVVVEPHPPLAASAGILGLAAGQPDGKGPRVMIYLIASRLASENVE